MKRKTGIWVALALLLIAGIAAALILGLRGCQSAKKAPDTGSNPGTEAIETEQPTDTKNAAPTTEATQNGETQTEPTTEDESASTEPASETAGTEEPGTDAATTTEPVTEPTSSTEPQLTEPQPTEPKPTEPQPTDPKPTDPTEPPHTHSYTSKVTKAATCTENGVTTYTCSCGDSYTKNEPKALGHNMGSWTVTKAATCTQSGTKTRSCQRSGCSYKETDTIPATGHNWKVTKAATCEASGTKTCQNCGATKSIPATGHDWGSWKQTQAPTCTAKGKEQRTCSRCNKTESRDVPALGHHMGSWTVTKAATCTESGTKTRSCQRNGCSYKETDTIPATGHNWKVTKAATCGAEGTEKCQNCGKTRTIPATGNHNWKQTKAPTCTQQGIETCQGCGKTRTVDALGHSWEEHPAEGHEVYTIRCRCGKEFRETEYSNPYEAWKAHRDSYSDPEEWAAHSTYQNTYVWVVTKPAYRRCTRCGAEEPL